MSDVSAGKTTSQASTAVSTGRILSAAEYTAYLAGIQDRSVEPAGDVKKLPSLHQEARRHGYEQGLRDMTAKFDATLRELRRYRNDRDAWLQAYVLAVLRKVLGDSDPASLVPAIVQQAIDQCDHGLETLTVHVHPDVVAAVKSRLTSTSANSRENGLRVGVEADVRLDQMACEINTPFGIVDAGLETQLNALEQALDLGDTAGLHDRP
ncbi:MAG: FliH/SctL family protein [Woeseiaceae bacterium]